MRILLPAPKMSTFPKLFSQVVRTQKVAEVTTQKLSSVGDTNPHHESGLLT